MANQQHIEWLLEGVEKWNARRRQEKFIPDLAGADLQKRNLSRFNLSLANLEGASCNETEFYNTNLHKACLRGAKLKAADLRESDLSSTDFTSADLRQADFGLSNFTDALLVFPDLRGADLRGANLTNASFNPLQIENADLLGAIFDNTDLGQSQIWKADGLFQVPSDAQEKVGDREAPCDQEIDSLNDLLNILAKLRMPKSQRLYLRGEPAIEAEGKKFELTPKVLRTNSDAENEAKFQVEFFTRQPEASKSANVALSELVVAQHYGLKTRLLDVTRNPLVALYFCCEEKRYWDDDGRVHLFLVPKNAIKPFNSDTISVLANFSKLTSGEQNAILTKRNPKAQYMRSLMRLYHFIGMEKPHFQKRIHIGDLFNVFVVEPKREFERIKAQSGAFLISAFHNRFETSEIRKLVPQAPVYEHLTLTVPSSAKKKILKELELLNITDETLFPSMAAAASAANEAP